MRAEEVHGLMEAYSKVYGAPEVLSEEVVEVDAEQLDEIAVPPKDPAAARAQSAAAAQTLRNIRNTLNPVRAIGTEMSKATERYRAAGPRDVKGRPLNQSATKPAATPAAKPAATPAAKPAAKPAATPAAKPAATPAAKPAAKPAATPAAKPAATSAAKPSTPAAPAKPAGSAMDQWAKANPKLAQAQKIRQQGGSRAEVNKVLYNKGTAPATSTPTVVKAGVDIFDLVKGYLLDEGYAESEDAAMVIMVNMSAEWKESILESCGVELEEAQEAREKPEEHEEKEKKEHDKKYGHVRGEKTPMPPRGDKRREDFEKWYAKNVR